MEYPKNRIARQPLKQKLLFSINLQRAEIELWPGNNKKLTERKQAVWNLTNENATEKIQVCIVGKSSCVNSRYQILLTENERQMGN